MTPKQIERLQKKIADVKKILAAEKRKFGCYDDSRGVRYLPTRYFIQLGDFAGGVTYLKWFYKNFPDDSGFPEFLFESSIIYFKTGRLQEAAAAAFHTFCSNPYWIDRFLGRPLTPLDMWHSSNITELDYTRELAYSSGQPDLMDFSAWLRKLVATEDFSRRSKRYIEIYRVLKTESNRAVRSSLIEEARQLEQAR